MEDAVFNASFAKLEELLPISEWDFIDLAPTSACTHPNTQWSVFMTNHSTNPSGCTYTIGYKCSCGHIVSSSPGSSSPCPGANNRHY